MYRGGQPDRAQLLVLKALGVEQVLDLRREHPLVRRAEHDHARATGLQFYHLPFLGIFGASNELLCTGLEAIVRGRVYVHCENGRDRTGLVVALYRVCVEGYQPADAWKHELLAFGHDPASLWNRRIRRSFERFIEANRQR